MTKTQPGAELSCQRQQGWRAQVETTHTENADLGGVFRTVIVISVGLAFSLAALSGLNYYRGRLDSVVALTLAAMAVTYALVCLSCTKLVKRRHPRRAMRLYVWVTGLAVSAACAGVGGAGSPFWPLYLWLILVAGVILAPTASLVLAGLGVGQFVLLQVAQRYDLYKPLVSFTSESALFQMVGVGLAVSLAIAFLVFLKSRSQTLALKVSLRAWEKSEEARKELEIQLADSDARFEMGMARLQALVNVGREFTAITDLNTLLATGAMLLCKHGGAVHAGIYLVDDIQGQLRLQGVSDEVARQRFDGVQNLSVGEPGLVQAALSTGRLRLEVETIELERWRGESSWPKIRSELAVPLEASGHIIGVLDLLGDGDFSQEGLSLVAHHLATAIDRARIMGRSRAAVARLEEYEQRDAVRGWQIAMARRNQRVGYHYDRIEMQPGLPDGLSALLEAHEVSGVESVEYEGVHWLLAPLRVQQMRVGTLSFQSSQPWTTDQKRFVATVVDQLGLALENARLLEDTRLSAQRERARSEIVGRVRSSVQIDAVLRSAVEALGRALQVDRARIQILPPGHWHAENRDGEVEGRP